MTTITPTKEKSAPGCNRESAQRVINTSKNTASPHKNQGKFNRNHLPAPMVVLNLLDMKPEKINPAGYWTLRCPFHAGGRERNPSLNLHSGSGHYKCHACGAKGGDILAFYISVTGLSFFEAVRNLGAWGVSK